MAETDLGIGLLYPANTSSAVSADVSKRGAGVEGMGERMWAFRWWDAGGGARFDLFPLTWAEEGAGCCSIPSEMFWLMWRCMKAAPVLVARRGAPRAADTGVGVRDGGGPSSPVGNCVGNELRLLEPGWDTSDSDSCGVRRPPLSVVFARVQVFLLLLPHVAAPELSEWLGV